MHVLTDSYYNSISQDMYVITSTLVYNHNNRIHTHNLTFIVQILCLPLVTITSVPTREVVVELCITAHSTVLFIE